MDNRNSENPAMGEEEYHHRLSIEHHNTLRKLTNLVELLVIIEKYTASKDVREAQVLVALHQPFTGLTGDGPLVCKKCDETDALMGRISTLLVNIDGHVPADFTAEIQSHTGGTHSFGELKTVWTTKPILRGFAEQVKTEPVGPVPSEQTVLFLKSVPGLKGALKRENHSHFGFHYHYLDKKYRRSDTILTFDDARTKLSKANAPRPVLVYEKHAEGKSDFLANMANWGDKKRISTYAVCNADLKRRSLTDYKRPNAKAQLLWS